jgi:hypothetical protein
MGSDKWTTPSQVICLFRKHVFVVNEPKVTTEMQHYRTKLNNLTALQPQQWQCNSELTTAAAAAVWQKRNVFARSITLHMDY